MNKKVDPGPGQVSFGKDLNPKMMDNISLADPKLRIKLCALFHLQKQKQQIDIVLHQELQKLKRLHEKRTIEIVKARNEVIKQKGTIVLRDYPSQIDMVKHDVNPLMQLECNSVVNYWYLVVKNCYLLKYLYSTKDGEIAKSIISIDIMREETKESKSFSLHFVLRDDQKYFTNSFISVTFYFLDSVNPYRQESNAEFKQKGKKDAAATGIFASLLQNINLEDALTNIFDAKDMCNRFGRNYEVAQIFKEELIPYSLEYYANTRDPQVKRDQQIDKEIEQLNEKKIKAKTKAAALIKDPDVEEFPEFLEDNQCNQQ